MLKGHVFKDQVFGNQIFALFINTFLNGQNGVSNNYKNGMQVTYNGTTLTVQSGAVCIQGRFLEEDTSTQISAGTDSSYCKLVIEIDLDKQNTEETLNQATYKIVKSTSGYPNLTQTDIVKNNEGIYQYELARFRTNSNGITNFQDMRTFLDIDSIYEQVQAEINNIKNGSGFVAKNNLAYFGLESSPETSININYPSGFNKGNTSLISFKSCYIGSNEWNDCTVQSEAFSVSFFENYIKVTKPANYEIQLVIMNTDFLKE